MKLLALAVLGEAVFLGKNAGRSGADDAGNERIFRETLLLHEQFERPEAPTAGWYLEASGFRTASRL